MSHRLAAALRRAANRLDPPRQRAAHPGATYDDVGPGHWYNLDVCQRSRRVGTHIWNLRHAAGLTPWDVADRLTENGWHTSPQDISDLEHGERHVRGANELAAIARALGVPTEHLTTPEKP